MKRGNQGDGGGAPPLYKTAKELQDRIVQYFEKGIPIRKVIVGPPNNRSVESIPVPTISGLVLYCGFADRSSFYNYEKQPKFSHTIKRARELIARCYEEQLHTGNPTGAIFALKNFGWTDRQVLEHTMPENLFEKYKGVSVESLRTKAIELLGRVGGSFSRN